MWKAVYCEISRFFAFYGVVLYVVDKLQGKWIKTQHTIKRIKITDYPVNGQGFPCKHLKCV